MAKWALALLSISKLLYTVATGTAKAKLGLFQFSTFSFGITERKKKKSQCAKKQHRINKKKINSRLIEKQQEREKKKNFFHLHHIS